MANQLSDVFINKIVCPITNLIYYEPVMASDGIIYEKDALDNIFNENCISPYTGMVLNKKIVIPSLVTKMTIEKNKDSIDYYISKNSTFGYYNKSINIPDLMFDILHKGPEYYKFILNCKRIYIDYFQTSDLKRFLRIGNEYYIKHFINNTVSIDYNIRNKNLVNLICENSHNNIINYLFNKIKFENIYDPLTLFTILCKRIPNISTNILDFLINNGIKIKEMHFLINNNEDYLKFLIKRNYENKYFRFNNTNMHIVIHILKYIGKNFDIIKYIIDNNIFDFNIKNGILKYSLVHYMFYYISPPSIKYLVENNKGLKLDTDKYIISPLDVACIHHDFELIKFLRNNNFKSDNLPNKNITDDQIIDYIMVQHVNVKKEFI